MGGIADRLKSRLATPPGTNAPQAGEIKIDQEQQGVSLLDRVKLAFAESPDQVNSFLQKKYGKENVHFLTSSNKFYMRNKGVDGFTPINPEGMDVGDLGELLAAIAPAIGQVVGGILTAPGTPAAQIMGEGLGFAAGQQANKAIGRSILGNPPEATVAGDIKDVIKDVTIGATGRAAEFGAGYITKKALAPFAKYADPTLISSAAKYGIETIPSEVSTSHTVDIIDEFLRPTLGASGQYAKIEAGRYSKAMAVISREIDKIGSAQSDYRTFGEAIQSAIGAFKTKALGKNTATGVRIPGISDRLYGKVYATAQAKLPKMQVQTATGMVDVPVIDFQRGKKLVSDLASELGEANSMNASLTKVMKSENVIPLKELLDLRSDMGRLASSGDVISTKANRTAGEIVGIIDESIRNAATQFNAPELISQLHTANKFYRTISQTLNETFLSELIKKQPTDVARLLLQTNRSEDIKIVRSVLKNLPKDANGESLWGNVQASYVDNLFRKVRTVSGTTNEPRLMHKKLNDMWFRDTRLDVKKELFPDSEQRQSMNQLIRFFSEVPVGASPNSIATRNIALSRAATTLGAAAAAGGGIGYALSDDPVKIGLISLGGLVLLPGLAAKLVLTKTGREFLTEGIRINRIMNRMANTAERTTGWLPVVGEGAVKPLSNLTRWATKKIDFDKSLVPQPKISGFPAEVVNEFPGDFTRPPALKWATRLSAYMAANPELKPLAEENNRYVKAVLHLQSIGKVADSTTVEHFLQINPEWK